jgi:hypothetical protein
MLVAVFASGMSHRYLARALQTPAGVDGGCAGVNYSGRSSRASYNGLTAWPVACDYPNISQTLFI